MKPAFLNRFGTVGAVVAAAACPICFPKLALIGAAVGLGVFAPYERYVAIEVQALFALAFIGQIVAFRRHRNSWLLALSAITTGLLFAGYYVVPSSILLQVSLAGLVVASIWLAVELRRCAKCVTPPTTIDRLVV
ncbi:MAG TPA: MerC family mercury resistance protein [Burkholderiaceae bacterium]|nr:MerC family mercury resistance protein [Burkholderiaceae bacterium]